MLKPNLLKFFVVLYWQLMFYLLIRRNVFEFLAFEILFQNVVVRAIEFPIMALSLSKNRFLEIAEFVGMLKAKRNSRNNE